MEIARRHIYDEETAELINRLARLESVEDDTRSGPDDYQAEYKRGDRKCRRAPRYGWSYAKHHISPNSETKRKKKAKAQRQARAKGRKK